ncbi:DNA polymerase III subunit beta [Salinarimonas sp.]|uniref:DNA polymerase III subunit beta n=1 Tax=Salinarimonas sp. TaxID=2766526 RepID=UPI003919E707
MKLTVTRAALLSAFETVGRAIERRTTIPILCNALLKAEGERLAVHGTDLDREAMVCVEARLQSPGAITVPAALLYDIAKKLPSESDIAIEADGGGDHIQVRSGRSRFRLQTLPADDFPHLKAIEPTNAFALSGKALARLIAKSKFAIPTEETRYYLNGIYLHVAEGLDGSMLRAVATDGHRLAQIATPAPDGAVSMPGIIMPRRMVEDLERLAKTAGAEEIELAVSSTLIRASHADTVLVSKLIDGTFPDYQRVIPQSNPHRAVLDARALAASMDRLAAVGTERGRAVKVQLDAGTCALELRSADIGEASDALDCEWQGPDGFAIGFNARYALELMAALDVDQAAIALADPGSPMLWTDAAAEGAEREQPNALYVLMPMRV